MNFPKLLSLGKKFGSLTLPEESHSAQGASVVFQRRQLQILEKLNELLTNMEELKEEIRFLKETIPKLEECIQDEFGGKVTVHKISPQHRARKKKGTTVQRSATSNSSEEAESEGGYITANTDTEEQNFPFPKALNTHIEELKLDVLLQKADHLRTNESHKMESFELLCDHKEKFSEETEFLWRLARAYGDMYDLSTSTQEKKHYANIGKTLGERAITRAPMNGHCHLWYAVLCGYVSEFEGLQNKINCGHLFKKHLEIAIQLLPEEPLLYYLKGRSQDSAGLRKKWLLLCSEKYHIQRFMKLCTTSLRLKNCNLVIPCPTICIQPSVMLNLGNLRRLVNSVTWHCYCLLSPKRTRMPIKR